MALLGSIASAVLYHPAVWVLAGGRFCRFVLFFYRVAADYWWFSNHPHELNKLLNPLKDNIFGRLDDFVVGMAAARLASRDIRVPIGLVLTSSLCLVFVGGSWA
jgi:hypothetical protein